MEKRRPGHPIEPDSVRHQEGGFAKISIGRESHRQLRQVADKNGTTIAALVSDFAKQISQGKQVTMIEHKATVGDLATKVEAQSDINLKVLTLCVALNRALGLRTDIILGEKVEIDKVGEIAEAELARRSTVPAVSQLTLEAQT